MPIRRNGTRGKAFGNANRDVMGRNPRTIRVASVAVGRPGYGRAPEGVVGFG